jgi:nucleotide-binding universal stress UspA family protein
MKILVPTDFLMYADFALDAAIQIAKKNKGEIHLYHSAQIPDDWEDFPAELRYKDSSNKKITLWVRDKLNALCLSVKEQGIDCKFHYTGGRFVNNIQELFFENDFDLVVMGSHGASGKEEWFIGSNTQKVIRKLHCNVLVIKNKINIDYFKNVVFVTGLDNYSEVALKNFLKFISPFSIEKLHIMTVNTSSFFTQPAILVESVLKDLKEIPKGYNVQTHFYPDDPIDLGVKHFSEEYNVDLIGISNIKRHPIKRIFQGSTVEMCVNHSDIPVLSIDINQKKDTLNNS